MLAIRQIFKLYLFKALGISRIRYGKNWGEKVRSVSIPLVILFTLISQSSLLYFMLQQFSALLVISPVASLIIGAAATAVCMVVFATNALGSSSLIFKGKDLEFWFSMPVRKTHVLLGKMVILIFWNIATSLFAFIPLLILYYERVGIGKFNPFLILPALIFLTVIPGIVGLLVSLLFSLLFKPSRRSNRRTMLSVVLSLAVAMIIMFSSFFTLNPNRLQALFGLLIRLSDLNWLAKVFTRIVVDHDLGSFFLLVGLSTAIFIGFGAVVGRFYAQIAESSQAKISSQRSSKFGFTASSQLMALSRREIRKYFSCAVLVTNTIFAPVMITIFNVVLIFRRDLFAVVLPMAQELGISLSLVAVLFLTVMIGMTQITASSISLEGKSFSLLKSFPVSTMQIFLAKAAVSILLCGIALLLNLPLLAINFGLSAVDILFCALIGVSYLFLIPAFGLVVNLFAPSFNWDTETIVVKQNFASFIGTLGGMVIAMLPLGVFFVGGDNRVQLLLILTVTLVLNGLFYLLLRNWGTKRFESLNP